MRFIFALLLMSAFYISTASAQTFSFTFGSFGTGAGGFGDPTGIAVDSSGNIYVADGSFNRIQKFDSEGNFVLMWGWGVKELDFKEELQTCTESCQKGVEGSGDGQFSVPKGVAVDSSGNVYVADLGNSRVQKFDSEGNFLLKFGTLGAGDGELNSAWDMAVDGSGNIYVTESENYRIQMFDSNGDFKLMWGYGVRDGTDEGQLCMGSCQRGIEGSANAQFSFPMGITVDGSGNVSSTDNTNNRVQNFGPEGSFNFLTGTEGSGDGEFNMPWGIASDGPGNLYAVDYGNNRVQKFDPKGNFLLKFGTMGSGNGEFIEPTWIAVDSLSNIYVTDPGNDRIQVFTSDTDGDGLSNPDDLDSDNDGITNNDESSENGQIALNFAVKATTLRNAGQDDADGDGIINLLDLDSDGDCIPDHFEAGGGNDGDMDGLSDNFVDIDADGHHDEHDADQTGNSLPLPDTDGDSVPDYLDRDSDNDGMSDAMEAGGVDMDGDGLHDDTEDLNTDGLADSCHPDTGTPLAILDLDTNGVPDHLEAESNGGSSNCSLVPAGASTSFPLYLLIPAIILVRRIRKSRNDT